MKELTENPTATPPSQPGLVSEAVVSEKIAREKDGEDSHEPPEVRVAKELARRYRLNFVELLPTDQESPIDFTLFNEIPVDLMVRHQFLPLKRDEKGLHIAMADPTDLERLDELQSALKTRIVPYVATAGAIEVMLRSASYRKQHPAFASRWSEKRKRAKRCLISIAWRLILRCRQSSNSSIP